MNIALITSQLSIGGAEKMVCHLAQGLQRRGHRVTVIAGGGIFGPKLREAGLEVIDLPLSAKWKWLFPVVWRQLYYLLRSQNYDIVHVHTAPLAFFLRVIQRLGGIEAGTVLTLHGSPAWKLKLTRFLLKSLRLKRCAVSPALAQLTSAYYIPNAVEIEPTPANIQHPAFKRGTRTDSQYLTVGIIARLAPEKGLDLWLKALGMLAQEGVRVKTLIAGDGPERTKLEQEGITCGQEVVFYGFLTNPWQVMHEIDLLVIPSRREGEPLTLLEGMARGKPVLAAEVGGIPPLLAGGAGILAEPSAAGLARALKEFLALTSRQKEGMIALGRSRVAARTWDHCLDSYEQVYTEAGSGQGD